MEFVKIANYAFPAEAEMVVSMLKEQGIPALLRSASAGVFGSSAVPSPGGVSLLVPEGRAEEALRFLELMDKF